MSYSDEEVTKLKSILQDVIDRNFLSSYLQMREKLTTSQQKLNYLLERVEKCEQELSFYKYCDDCKRINKLHHNATTQTCDLNQTSPNEKPPGEIAADKTKVEEGPRESGVGQNREQSNLIDLTAKRPRLAEEPIVITIDDDDD